MMACLHLLKDKVPTLILSGVNWGSNLADDVTYSGTIAGAMEGCALGIPSIALSQSYDESSRLEIDWSAGETHGADVVRRLVAAGWPVGTLMNVNFPACAAADVKKLLLETDRKRDSRQRAYYWIGLRRRRATPPGNSDLGAVTAGKIAVTPLHLNLTEMSVLETLRGALEK